MIYKSSSSGLLLPSRGLAFGADNIRPNTISEGDHTLDPGGGPVFEAGVIHAWNPDAGADASGIIADAVGSANMWIRLGLDPVTDFTGAFPGGTGPALIVDHADITDFKIATPTLTFWMYEEPASPFYGALASIRGPSDALGDFWMARSGDNTDQQNQVYMGYQAGSSGANPRVMLEGQWNLWTIRLGASKWRVLGNSAVTLSSASWSSTSFAGNTGPLSLAQGYTRINDHTEYLTGDFIGRFGDVRLWDKSLSDAEIAALYAAGRQSY